MPALQVCDPGSPAIINRQHHSFHHCAPPRHKSNSALSDFNNQESKSSIVNQFSLGLARFERSAAQCARQQDGPRIPVGRRSVFRNPHSTALATPIGIRADHEMARLHHPTTLKTTPAPFAGAQQLFQQS